MRVTLYGIRNCDTVKKARAWLDGRGLAYAFHDTKASGIDRETLNAWCAAFGWESVLNRRGTTFRALPDARKENLDSERAIDLMLEQPSMIKRPMLDRDGALELGFDPQRYAHFFSA